MYPASTAPLDTLLRSALALLASALILLAGFAVHAQRHGADVTAAVQPLRLPGRDLQPVVGTAKVVGDALQFTGYEPRDGEQVAVAVWRGRVQASDFPLLQYQVDTGLPGARLKLLWRTTEAPDTVRSADLPGTDGNTAWLRLSRYPDWRGTLLAISVYAYTSDASDALSIAHLTLQPASWRAELATVWSAWTGYRGWTARSINQLYGTADTRVLSPVPVAAAWSALAVLLVLLSARLAPGRAPGAFAAALLLPWIALDLLWQRELTTQLLQTRDQFAGRTVEEKHLADIDRHIYRYIARLKQDKLPEDPARILILHQSFAHNFDRLKAQYYLLPHNAYNFGRVPPDRGLETVDYILVLGTVPRLEFDASAQALRWQRGTRSLAVELLDDDYIGRLYRVLPGAGGSQGAAP